METATVDIDGLFFRHKRASRPSLADISAHVGAKTIALMGAAGSGKSSLCYALNGVIPHIFRGDYAGQVEVCGQSISSHRVWQLARTVGLVLQEFDAQLVASSVEDELAFGLEGLALPRDEIGAAITRFLRLIHFEPLRACAPASLSGGQRQLLAFAAVAITEPRVMVLDESTTDLDEVAQSAVMRLLRNTREQGGMVFVADHKIEAALEADELWLLAEGRLAARGRPEDLLADRDLLNRYSIRVPPITELMQRLGYPKKLYSLSDATEILSRNMSARAPACSGGILPGRSGAPILRANGVGYRYPGQTGRAVHDATVEVGEGEFVALMGRNGCGKTTLAKMLAGLYTPLGGEVRLHGRPIAEYSAMERARHVGYVFQNPDRQIFAASVRAEVGFGPSQLGYPTAEIERMTADALHAVGLCGYESRDPVLLTRGERQRVAVASTLATRPRIIILDEPNKGMDHNHQLSFFALLRSLASCGHTLILITHALWLAAENCSRIVVMRDGGIAIDDDARRALRDGARLRAAGLVAGDAVSLANVLSLQSIALDHMEAEIRARLDRPRMS